jgi:hypothetical protein
MRLALIVMAGLAFSATAYAQTSAPRPTIDQINDIAPSSNSDAVVITGMKPGGLRPADPVVDLFKRIRVACSTNKENTQSVDSKALNKAHDSCGVLLFGPDEKATMQSGYPMKWILGYDPATLDERHPDQLKIYYISPHGGWRMKTATAAELSKPYQVSVAVGGTSYSKEMNQFQTSGGTINGPHMSYRTVLWRELCSIPKVIDQMVCGEGYTIKVYSWGAYESSQRSREGLSETQMTTRGDEFDNNATKY